MKPEVLLIFARFEECVTMLKGIAQYNRTHQAWVAFLDDAGIDCAFTGSRSHRFLWREGDAARGAVAVNHDSRVRPRRQDRPPEFIETGAVYAMRTDGFRVARHRFFGRAAIYEVPTARALEIDEPTDLALAEALLLLAGQG